MSVFLNYLFIAFFILGAAPVLAQEGAPAVSSVPASTGQETSSPEPTENILKKKEYTAMPQVRIRILDKVRAVSRTYDLDVDHTVAYANLRIRPRTCRKSSPLDDPENAAFLQIWEVDAAKKSSWVFSGWMFSSTPSLSAMDHPVYDVTVLACIDPKASSQAEGKPTPPSTTDVLDEYISTGDMNDTLVRDKAPASSE
jgi:hypothetical protein